MEYTVGMSVERMGEILLNVFFVIFILVIVLSIFTIICNWKIFKKAGKEGWECIVPVYNFIVLFEIANVPMWFIVFLLIPGLNICILFYAYVELAKKFGKSDAFGLGLIFLSPIFLGILAFSKNCVYKGSVAAPYGQSYNGQSMYHQTVNNFQQQQVMQTPPLQSSCSKCGSPVGDGDKFCMNCGNQIM